ncbi:hypothetical protein [Paenibacillus periandrae]|uniref:hypothetical protein n=1 Tax=Paenibacillus periandrae TaxID=1761741 RepID=UPI001F0924BE|nr:hypothetical protein [Paenibacillus periandrae]
MDFEGNHFRKPSKYWMWVLIPLGCLLLVITATQLVNLLTVSKPELSAKTYFLLSFAFLLTTIYLSFGYLYLLWATPLKNTLVEIFIKDDRVLVYRFERYLVDESILLNFRIDARPYKKLSQKDLKDVKFVVGQEGR